MIASVPTCRVSWTRNTPIWSRWYKLPVQPPNLHMIVAFEIHLTCSANQTSDLNGPHRHGTWSLVLKGFGTMQTKWLKDQVSGLSFYCKPEHRNLLIWFCAHWPIWTSHSIQERRPKRGTTPWTAEIKVIECSDYSLFSINRSFHHRHRVSAHPTKHPVRPRSSPPKNPWLATSSSVSSTQLLLKVLCPKAGNVIYVGGYSQREGLKTATGIKGDITVPVLDRSIPATYVPRYMKGTILDWFIFENSTRKQMWNRHSLGNGKLYKEREEENETSPCIRCHRCHFRRNHEPWMSYMLKFRSRKSTKHKTSSVAGLRC